MPRLSIVIPALGAWELLETTLVSVLANRPADAEIVVAVHDGYDDPYGLEGEVRFVRLPTTATTVEAWNDACVSCQAQLIHLLACGAVVGEGWCDQALPHFNDPQVASVAPLVATGDETSVHSAGWCYSIGGEAVPFAAGRPVDSVGEPDDRWLGPHGAAAFYRRSALASALAAFDASLGENLAPLDLALRLRTAGYRSVFEPRCRVALATLPGPCRHSAFQAERLFWRHAAQDGLWQPVVAHVGAVALEFARAFPQPRCAWQLAQRLAALVPWRRATSTAYRLELYVAHAPLDATSARHRVDPSHEQSVRGAKRRAVSRDERAAASGATAPAPSPGATASAAACKP